MVWLGGPVPGRHLVRWLATHDVDAVVFTCSRVPSLLGAARSLATAQLAGLPVVVGGAAITPARAHGLGAAGGSAAGSAAVGVVHGALAAPPHHDVAAEHGRRSRLAACEAAAGPPERVAEALGSALGQVGGDGHHRLGASLRQWAEDVVATVGASCFLDDPSVVAELVVWLLATMHARGMPEPAARRLRSRHVWPSSSPSSRSRDRRAHGSQTRCRSDEGNTARSPCTGPT